MRIKSPTKKLIIFDLDGTLYDFKGGSFQRSKLRQKILENAKKFIAARLKKSDRETARVLRDIIREYGENISIGLEKRFKLNRLDYFETVWNVPAWIFVQTNPSLRRGLLTLRRRFDFLLLSDAPRVWVDNVLSELGVNDLFKDRIFSGEGDRRKVFGNVFEEVKRLFRIDPRNCIVIGDQEDTDIVPAHRTGMKSILISRTKKSSVADYRVKNIGEAIAVVRNFN